MRVVTVRRDIVSSSLFLLIIVMIGCIDTKDTDSWYRYPEDFRMRDWEEMGWKVIDSFIVVPKERQKEAIRALNKRPIIKLTEDDYIYYGGEEGGYCKGYQYLVRSLIYYQHPKNTDIYYKGNSVFVDHGSLGSKKVPLRKQAIIIESQTEIDEVFVSSDHAK